MSQNAQEKQTAKPFLTMEDVRQSVLNDTTLTDAKRRDNLSALNRLSHFSKMPLEELSAGPRKICNLFNTFSPVQLGISEKTFSNIRSAVNGMLKEYGTNKASSTPLMPEWQNLLDQIPVPQIRWGCVRLARFASAHNILPHELSNDHLQQFHDELTEEGAVKNPQLTVKIAVKNWNRCHRFFENWPYNALKRPSDHAPYSFKLEEFPLSFQQDVAAWEEKMLHPDLLDFEARIKPLREETVASTKLAIRRMASAIVHRGIVRLEELGSLNDLFIAGRFKEGLRFFLERQNNEKTKALHNLACTMKHLAKHHCKISEEDFADIETSCRRLAVPKNRQMTEKNRTRLLQFESEQNIQRLLFLPETLLQESKKPGTLQEKARLAEKALIISLLLHCVVRKKTLRTLELTDFQTSASGDIYLHIPGKKVKTGKPLDFKLSEETKILFTTYISTHRRQLPGAEGNYLFPGITGGARSKNAISAAIEDTVKKYTGLTMNPHLFRHAIAKIATEHDPNALFAVSRVYGHTNLDTTTGHYMETGTKRAGEYLDNIIQAKKKGG